MFRCTLIQNRRSRNVVIALKQKTPPEKGLRIKDTKLMVYLEKRFSAIIFRYSKLITKFGYTD
jgi:hypothetical protein